MLFVVAALPNTASGQMAAAMNEWFACLDSAADRLSQQPEPAEVVVKAARSVCSKTLMEFQARLLTGTGKQLPQSETDQIAEDRLLGRVMALRAVRRGQ